MASAMTFNRMTIAAATSELGEYCSHADLELLEVEWGINGRCRTSSKSAHAADLSKIAIEENPDVYTQNGVEKLALAIIETVLRVAKKGQSKYWDKFVSGLHMDGFEVCEEVKLIEPEYSWQPKEQQTVLMLRRMLPDDVPGLDFRDAESELIVLLDKHALTTAKGHLTQAQSALSRGDWAAANAQIRSFYEEYLNEIARRFGYIGSDKSDKKRDFLGQLNPPFLFSEYNEWNANSQKPQFVQGLMSRLHPAGSHPGLSDEDDSTFRMQISLITARFFLRRYDQRIA